MSSIFNNPLGAFHDAINWVERNNVLRSVSRNGLELHNADIRFRNDREIVLAAVQERGGALQWASDALKNDREIVLAAIGKDPQAFRYASEILQNNKDFVIEVLQNHRVLGGLSAELRNDRDVVLAAVQKNGDELCWASDTLRNDEQIVLAAVSESRTALQSAADPMKTNIRVLHTIIQQQNYSYISIGNQGRRDTIFYPVKDSILAFEIMQKIQSGAQSAEKLKHGNIFKISDHEIYWISDLKSGNTPLPSDVEQISHYVQERLTMYTMTRH